MHSSPRQILFSSNDLLVRRVRAGSAPAIAYVTFDCYTDRRTLDRPGFGEELLLARGIDAVHILSRDNHWYQYPEWPEALAAAAGAMAGYESVVAYGSSMGGYAALHYGRSCGASVGIAVSPQFSVDPVIVPFEDRWVDDVAGIAFRDEVTQPLPKQYILYDPQDRYDRAHFALYAARSPTIGIRIPHGGHPVGAYLVETRMFAQLFEAVRADRLDPLAFERQLKDRRRESAQYLFTLSRRLGPTRLHQKEALARMAVEASPRGAPYISNLALVLEKTGRFAEAKSLHHRATALEPDNYHVAHALVLHHEQLGELRTAARLVAPLVDRHPNLSQFRQTRLRIRRHRRQAHSLGRLIRYLGLDPWVDRWLDRLTDRMRGIIRRLGGAVG